MVKIVTLTNVTSPTSTSVKAEYYFVDPFGTLGMVYLELHDKATLDAAGLSVRDLYDPDKDGDKAIEEYWSRFAAGRRASISVYDNSYTFSGLEAGTQYYVVLAHVATDSETDAMTRTLDDYYRITTKSQVNVMSVSYVTKETVGVRLRLDSVNVCGEGARVKLELSGGGSVTHALTSDEIRKAISQGIEIELDISTSSAAFERTQTLKVVLADSEKTVLSCKSSNSFYTAATTP